MTRAVVAWSGTKLVQLRLNEIQAWSKWGLKMVKLLLMFQLLQDEWLHIIRSIPSFAFLKLEKNPTANKANFSSFGKGISVPASQQLEHGSASPAPCSGSPAPQGCPHGTLCTASRSRWPPAGTPILDIFERHLLGFGLFYHCTQTVLLCIRRYVILSVKRFGGFQIEEENEKVRLKHRCVPTTDGHPYSVTASSHVFMVLIFLGWKISKCWSYSWSETPKGIVFHWNMMIWLTPNFHRNVRILLLIYSSRKL